MYNVIKEVQSWRFKEGIVQNSVFTMVPNAGCSSDAWKRTKHGVGVSPEPPKNNHLAHLFEETET